jgi:hypothetical protein
VGGFARPCGPPFRRAKCDPTGPLLAAQAGGAAFRSAFYNAPTFFNLPRSIPPLGAFNAKGEISMSRYFFHIEYEDYQIKDVEGIELDGLDAVRDEALQSARELMSDNILKGHWPDSRRFIVTDESGVIVAEIPFAEATS